MTQLDAIEAVETRLRRAMLAGDIPALDALLADALQVVGPDGRLAGKVDDLAAHRAGAVRFTAMTPLETTIQPWPDMAIVFVRMAVAGLFEGQPFAGHYRYTRVWRRQGEDWQIIAAHISPVPDAL
jgi:ketosteroid isomerase-like protein